MLPRLQQTRSAVPEELDCTGLANCIGATSTSWGSKHDEAAAVADIVAWLKAPSCQSESEEESQNSTAESSRNGAAISLHSATSTLAFSAPVSVESLFQSTVQFVEHYVPAEFIDIDDMSKRIEATVYETFIPLHVAIFVRSAQLGPSSEVNFLNICGRDVVCFHQLFSRATNFLQEATVASRVRAPLQLEFLDFESEEESEEQQAEEDESAKANAVEAAFQPFVAKLSSHRARDREEAVSMLATVATQSPGCRRLLNVVIARQEVLSALERLLCLEGVGQETACNEAARYPVLALLVCLTEGNFMKVEVAQALHSMLLELDLRHCSALVQAELNTALNGIGRIVAGQN
mmetsp:Transcript_60704/g.117014  ORF Transcript_60704/g.117014 Transcript_60704/m.117014 type:complete len:349 (+) Transcript_60704:112-1158(+)